MITKSADELHALVRRILLAAGADERNAEEVAEHLVLANLSGVDTHGIWPLPIYVTGIQANEILPTAKPAILQETGTSALVTGNWTFGQSGRQICDGVGDQQGQNAKCGRGRYCADAPHRPPGPLCGDGSR